MKIGEKFRNVAEIVVEYTICIIGLGDGRPWFYVDI